MRLVRLADDGTAERPATHTDGLRMFEAMSFDNSVTASPRSPWLPPRWIIRAAWKTHRGLYRITGGRFGLRPPRADRYGLAQLTVTGRRSGLDRSVMIAYFRDGDDFVTMAMNGWAESEPAWWLNLQAAPHALLTAPDISIHVSGRAAEGAERDRLWGRWRHYDKGLDGYATRRPNETAVVVLSPPAASRYEPDTK